MRYFAIDNDGRPWLLIATEIEGSIGTVLQSCQPHLLGAGFTTREPTDIERSRVSAAHAVHVLHGGRNRKVFAMPA